MRDRSVSQSLLNGASPHLAATEIASIILEPSGGPPRRRNGGPPLVRFGNAAAIVVIVVEGAVKSDLAAALAKKKRTLRLPRDCRSECAHPPRNSTERLSWAMSGGNFFSRDNARGTRNAISRRDHRGNSQCFAQRACAVCLMRARRDQRASSRINTSVPLHLLWHWRWPLTEEEEDCKTDQRA